MCVTRDCPGEHNIRALRIMFRACIWSLDRIATLYLITIGMGGIKACVSAFGVDQFDSEDPGESKSLPHYFSVFFGSVESISWESRRTVTYSPRLSRDMDSRVQRLEMGLFHIGHSHGCSSCPARKCTEFLQVQSSHRQSIHFRGQRNRKLPTQTDQRLLIVTSLFLRALNVYASTAGKSNRMILGFPFSSFISNVLLELRVA